MAQTSEQHGIAVERVVTINRSPAELYQFWRNFTNLPQFMDHLKTVTVSDATHSHWEAKAPAGATVSWDAEITDDQENKQIAWRSLPNATIPNDGIVTFTPAPGDRGTEVRVTLRYAPLAGRVGAAFAKLFGEEPDQQVREDLRHFKQIIEAGEVPTLQGQPMGHR